VHVTLAVMREPAELPAGRQAHDLQKDKDLLKRMIQNAKPAIDNRLSRSVKVPTRLSLGELPPADDALGGLGTVENNQTTAAVLPPQQSCGNEARSGPVPPPLKTHEGPLRRGAAAGGGGGGGSTREEPGQRQDSGAPCRGAHPPPPRPLPCREEHNRILEAARSDIATKLDAGQQRSQGCSP
jgi:hypothetical protein